MSEKAIVPVEEKAVIFYDDQVVAVRLPNDEIFVPIRPICDAMGLNWSGQRQRIQRNPVLSEVLQIVRLSRDNTSGGNPNVLCMPLDYLNGWLFGIDANRVRPEIRDRLIRYQKECYRILTQAFQKQEVTAAATIAGIDVDELLHSSDDPEAYAYRIALAVANMARQQLVLRYQLHEQGGRLDDHAQQLGAHAERLDLIESTLGDSSRHISAAQASHISQAVKAIALELGKRSGRNEFGGVYGELYRRFSISGYRELPASRFEEAVKFLTEWHQSLVGDAPF
ncbi:MAG: ORF6C domain-containing protein [Anaerolineales bacterium]|nr:ORF6C domain-containing protein [Anaerolineales bacterium]